MKLILAAIGLNLAILALATSNLNAATYTVSNTADSGAGSLRQAILDANAGGGDIVMTGVSGTITLSSNLPSITASVNLLGPGTNVLTISGSNRFSVFAMNAGTTNTLSNLTVADAYAQYLPSAIPIVGYAAGVANFGSLRIQGCVFQQCNGYLTDGGAIYNSGTLEMDDCLITDCLGANYYHYSSDVYGGGVFSSGTLMMNSCTITNCVAKNGGGIYSVGTSELTKCLVVYCGNDDPDGGGGGICSSGSMTLNACVISNNDAGWSGGGICGGGLVVTNTIVMHNGGKDGGGVALAGTNLFVDCTISSNFSWLSYGGGGVKNSSVLTMANCTINGNSCETGDSDGGGGVENRGTLIMTNCTVSGNVALPTAWVATTHGGGIMNFSTNLVLLVNCTVVSNTVSVGTNDASGGAIESPLSAVTLQDTIVANNAIADLAGTLNSRGHNLIQNTNGCTITGDSTGNLYGVDPLLGPLQNNGGRTATHALLPGSPAIDAGPTNAAPFIDQRGAPRPFGLADDIGAFEFGSMPCCRMTSLAPSGFGCFQVKVTGIPGFTYTVQKGSSPSGPWTPLTIVTIDADGNGVCLDPTPNANSGFYRTVVQPQLP